MKFKNKKRHDREDFKRSTEQENSAVIFGVLPILEKLRSNPAKVEKIFIAEGSNQNRFGEIYGLAKEHRVLIQKVPRQNLAKFVDLEANHQGIVAIVASADYVNADDLFAEVVSNEDCLVLILDGIEDPRNFGAILRTAEGAGVDGVFIPERRAVGLNETVAKSSAGAIEYVKVAKVTNINNLIDDLKKENVWVVGTSLDTKTDYTEWDWNRKTAIVLGSEGKGLHRLTAEKCDILVKIPMLGKIQSLNVSVSSGVILYEAIRSRKSQR